MSFSALLRRSIIRKASRALSTAAGARDPAVIVVGGAGAVGRSIVSEFNAHNWSTISADLVPNSEASFNAQLPDPAAVGLDAWRSGVEALSSELPLGDAEPTVRAVVCAAGGWAGGGADSEEMLDSVVSMLQMNALSAAAAARLAGLSLCRDGTGAFVRFACPGRQPRFVLPLFRLFLSSHLPSLPLPLPHAPRISRLYGCRRARHGIGRDAGDDGLRHGQGSDAAAGKLSLCAWWRVGLWQSTRYSVDYRL